MNRLDLHGDLKAVCKHFVVHSKWSCVLVGNKKFSILFPNEIKNHHYYDAPMTDVFVIENNSFNTNDLDAYEINPKYFTTIEGGKMEIHKKDYDIQSEVVFTLSGRYGVYFGHGFVVFEKWDD